MARLLNKSEGENVGGRIWTSFHVGIFILFDSAPESVKKSKIKIISRSGG